MVGWRLAVEGEGFGFTSDTFLAYFSETYFAEVLLVEQKLELGLANFALIFALDRCGGDNMIG